MIKMIEMNAKFIIKIILCLSLITFGICNVDESSSINIIYTDQQIKEANSNNNARNLDIVFLVDNTGSMTGEINEVIKNLNTIVSNVSNLKLLTGKVRYGAIKYQDYADVYLSEKVDLTENIDNVKSFIDGMRADGGGDFPEAAAEAFRQASEMNWRENAVKLIFWIADAPPHPSKINELQNFDSSKEIKNYISNFSSKRSNSNQLTWKGEVIKLQEQGIIVHSILVRNDSSTREVMSFIARETKGMVISLNSSSIITPIIVNLVGEGLDRDRISNYIDKILQTNKDTITLLNLKQKENFVLNEVNKLALRGLKLRLDIKPIENNQFTENVDVQLEFKDLTLFDIKDSLSRINPCIKYNVFCDYTPEITPKSGIILDGNNSLLLQKTNVEIEILDTLTNVNVIQEFKNTFEKEANGEYIFPLPLNSSVHEFYADINGKRLFGRVFTKYKANLLYKLAVQSGNQAFLLSQENSSIYKVNLGNIPANSSVKINFKFSYTLEDNFGKYQVIFPINAFPDEKSTNSTIICNIKSSNNEIQDLSTTGNSSDVTLDKATIKYSGLLDKDFTIEYSLKKISNKENKIVLSSFNNKEYSSNFLGINDNFSNTNDYPFYALRGEFINSKITSINCPDFYVYVDSSLSLSYNKNQLNSVLNNFITNLKQKNTCNSTVKVISFDSKCTILREGVLSQISSANIETSSNSAGSYLIPCLKEINFDSDKIRVVVLSDFYISDHYELVYAFEQSYKTLKNIKLGLIGVGNRINRELLKRLSLSTKVKFLEILPSSNSSQFSLVKWLDNLLIEEKSFILSIKDKGNKIVYDRKNKDFLSNDKIICNDDSYNSNEYIFYCLVDKKDFSLNNIKEFQYLINDSIIEVKEIIQNTSNDDNTLDILVARNILTDTERIYDDLINMGKSTSIIEIKQETNDSFRNYTYTDYTKSQPSNKLKSLIEKIGVAYRLVSKFTSFLAVDDEFIKKNEKILNEEEPEEINPQYLNTNTTSVYTEDSLGKPVTIDTKTSSGGTFEKAMYSGAYSPTMEMALTTGEGIKMDALSSVKNITIEIVLLLALIIMFYL